MAQRSEEQAGGRLWQELLAQREELNVLRSTAGTGQNAVSIERATQQQLLGRIRELEAQNGALKEDIRLFELLIPMAGKAGVIRVENFRIVHEAAGRYRYRLLFSFLPDKQNLNFRGRFQLVIGYVVSGKMAKMILPDREEDNTEYRLELKSFLRREGGFDLPDGATVQSAEVRVLQGDTLKFRQEAQL